jgi:norsolorinic acid ketoreductase
VERDPSSDLIISYLSTDEIKTPAALFGSLIKEYNIKHIDTLIVNAASSSFNSTLEESMKSIKESFEINTFLPISVFQTFHPLLAKSEKPKFIYISSAIGSIQDLTHNGTFPVLAYGAAKAAADFFVRKIHFEFPDFVSLIIHPGYVSTILSFLVAR